MFFAPVFVKWSFSAIEKSLLIPLNAIEAETKPISNVFFCFCRRCHSVDINGSVQINEIRTKTHDIYVHLCNSNMIECLLQNCN